jgi:nitrogen fixation protein NifB
MIASMRAALGLPAHFFRPGQALHYVTRLLDMGKPISVAGIAGPGDPFANSEETLETMRLLRRKLPDLLLCISTNGLGIAPHIEELAEIGVSHVTITISAVDPEVGQYVYAWIRDGKKVLRGIEAAERMIEKQLAAVRRLKELDIVVKVNSVLIPGVNEDHIVDIARKCNELGVDLHNVIPLTPVEGTDFEGLEEPSPALVNELRKQCDPLVTQMRHCQRCRADACGLLCESTTQETMDILREEANAPIKPSEDRPYVAVASREGVLVNLHLGEAEEFQIYGPDGDGFALIDTRTSPPKGCGDDRWNQMASGLSDCRAILVSSCGPRPTEVLTDGGIKVIVMEGLIDEALSSIYSGEEIKAPVREFKCGVACTGDGSGCG